LDHDVRASLDGIRRDWSVVSAPAIAVDGIAASRKRISPFVLFQPASVAEALELMAAWPAAVLHAGGIDLANRMKAGLVAPAVIALDRIGEMKGVARSRDSLNIGAAVTHWQIEHDSIVRSCRPDVAAYVAGLGNVRVRVQGTIGGNIMAAEPGYEMLALLAALDANLHFAKRSDGTRYVVEARGFQPAISAAADILLMISIPLHAPDLKWTREMRPNLGIVASLDRDGDSIRSGYGAVTGQATAGSRLGITESGSQREIAARARELAESWAACIPIADTTSGADPVYMRHVMAVLMRRLLIRMTGQDR
jgi:aerobic carbon-monoxide dehydrogenase medium subunit